MGFNNAVIKAGRNTLRSGITQINNQIKNIVRIIRSLEFTEFKRLYSQYHGKTGLVGYVYNFSVDCNIIDNCNIINSHKYLMKKSDIK